MEWRFDGLGADGFERIAVSGDCDLYSFPGFTAAVFARIATGAVRLRIDFSSVRYLDSSGVGGIIRILQELRKRGGELRVSGITGSPRRVLAMSNILPMLREE